jgi:hypothetical protein
MAISAHTYLISKVMVALLVVGSPRQHAINYATGICSKSKKDSDEGGLLVRTSPQLETTTWWISPSSSSCSGLHLRRHIWDNVGGDSVEFLKDLAQVLPCQWFVECECCVFDNALAVLVC